MGMTYRLPVSRCSLPTGITGPTASQVGAAVTGVAVVVTP